MAKTTFKGKDGLPVRLLNDRLLVHIDSPDGERKSSGGIVIPATDRKSVLFRFSKWQKPLLKVKMVYP